MAFSGRAANSTGVFLDTPDDLSDLVALASPREFPFLDLVGDALVASVRSVHRWPDDNISTSRGRNVNHMQLFTERVVLSAEDRMFGAKGIRSGLVHQLRKTLREALRSLEGCLLRAGDSEAPNGQATASREMRGLLSFLTSVPSNELSKERLDIVLKRARRNGPTDLDVIACDVVAERWLQHLKPRSRTVREHGKVRGRRAIGVFEDSFGEYEIVPVPRFPRAHAAIISRQHITIIPRQGNSFHYEPSIVGERGGEAGAVAGEYTLEVRHGTSMISFEVPRRIT